MKPNPHTFQYEMYFKQKKLKTTVVLNDFIKEWNLTGQRKGEDNKSIDLKQFLEREF